MKENDFYFKRVHIGYAKWDKKNDDFHILPSPVVTVCKLTFIKILGIGIKWGFWGIGIGFSYTRKDVDIQKKDETE